MGRVRSSVILQLSYKANVRSLELTVSIMAASIPALQPVWTAAIHKYRLRSPRKMSGYPLRTQVRHGSTKVGNHPERPHHDLEMSHSPNESTDSISSHEISQTALV